jgi:uncharacterized integral membrane protein
VFRSTFDVRFPDLDTLEQANSEYDQDRKTKMLGLLRTIFLVVISVLATVFVIQNLATIEVAFLTWSFAAPRAVIFVLLLSTGLLVGYLLHALRPSSLPKRARPAESAPGDISRDHSAVDQTLR